jgi:cytochrome bd-type quinol oxidase subunit 2
MPLVFAYNVFAHRVFRGKLDTGLPAAADIAEGAES